MTSAGSAKGNSALPSSTNTMLSMTFTHPLSPYPDTFGALRRTLHHILPGWSVLHPDPKRRENPGDPKDSLRPRAVAREARASRNSGENLQYDRRVQGESRLISYAYMGSSKDHLYLNATPTALIYE